MSPSQPQRITSGLQRGRGRSFGVEGPKTEMAGKGGEAVLFNEYLSSDNYSLKFRGSELAGEIIFPFFQGVIKNLQGVTSNAMNLNTF